MKYNFIVIIIFILLTFLIINYVLRVKELFSTTSAVGFCAYEGNQLGLRLYDGTNYTCVPMNSNPAKNFGSNKDFNDYTTGQSSQSGETPVVKIDPKIYKITFRDPKKSFYNGNLIQVSCNSWNVKGLSLNTEFSAIDTNNFDLIEVVKDGSKVTHSCTIVGSKLKVTRLTDNFKWVLIRVSGDYDLSSCSGLQKPDPQRPYNTVDENICVPNTSDFGKICRSRYDKQYGVKEIQDCGGDNVKIKCGKLIFNKVNYSDGNDQVYSTDCLNKSLDMDTMCNVYMPNNIKDSSKRKGYYDKSGGTNIKLLGKTGDCYTHDGSPDLSKARGICNLRSNKQINRIRPFSYENDYNKFTDCNDMERHNFVSDCKNILGEDVVDSEVFADIHGFDCMPGYARAKCVNKSDIINIPPDLRKLKLDSKSNIFSFNKEN